MITLPVMAALNAAFASVTDRDIDRAARSLRPMNDRTERALGVAHSDEARKVWAVAHMMDYKSTECFLRAKFLASNEDEQRIAFLEGKRCSLLENLAREIFWTQVKEDIGGAAIEADQIGVRSGWMVVSMRSEVAGIEALFGRLTKGAPPEIEDE